MKLDRFKLDSPIPCPDGVKKIAAKLKKHNFECYIIGGAPRDFLLNKKAGDFDLITNANIEELKKIFPDAKEIGAAFGILKLGPYDLAMMRSEGEYIDGRHPEKVENASLSEDLMRRDFTVNTFCSQVNSDYILSVKGAKSDLENKVLKTVGDPIKRLTEDRLRILRAVRFSLQLGFRINSDIYEAINKIKKNSKENLLLGVSGERIRTELEKGLKFSEPKDFYSSLNEAFLATELLLNNDRIDLLNQSNHKDFALVNFFYFFLYKNELNFPFPLKKAEKQYIKWLNCLQSYNNKESESIKKCILSNKLCLHLELSRGWSFCPPQFLSDIDKIKAKYSFPLFKDSAPLLEKVSHPSEIGQLKIDLIKEVISL